MNTSEITDNILNSSKYHSIYRPTIERVVKNIIERYPEKQVEKVARQKLHQIWGAYFDRPNFNRIIKKIKERFEQGEAFEGIFLDLLKMQSSTRERLEHLNEFYTRLFEITGIPESIVEYGCGINPLTYPWLGKAETSQQLAMRKPINSVYIGTDVDQDLMHLITATIELAGYSESVTVRLGDVLTDKPIKADMMFLLKVSPLLERQQEGSTKEIIKNQPSRWIVVSYPTKSLSGKAKGMKENYEKEFSGIVVGEQWKLEKVEFENELLFVIGK